MVPAHSILRGRTAGRVAIVAFQAVLMVVGDRRRFLEGELLFVMVNFRGGQYSR